MDNDVNRGLLQLAADAIRKIKSELFGFAIILAVLGILFPDQWMWLIIILIVSLTFYIIVEIRKPKEATNYIAEPMGIDFEMAKHYDTNGNPFAAIWVPLAHNVAEFAFVDKD